jgi:hypothetical protein
VAALVLSLLIDAPDGRAHAGASPGAGETDVSENRGGRLGTQSTLRDVLRHPSFAGFSRLLLPWERRVEALRRAGTEVEYHRYKGVGHGFGLGTGTSAEGWVFDAIRFWETSLRRESLEPSK